MLHGHYGVPRKQVAEAGDALLDDVHCERAETIRRAFGLYSERALDFVDCVLVAEHELTGREIITFDNKVRRLTT